MGHAVLLCKVQLTLLEFHLSAAFVGWNFLGSWGLGSGKSEGYPGSHSPDCCKDSVVWTQLLPTWGRLCSIAVLWGVSCLPDLF